MAGEKVNKVIVGGVTKLDLTGDTVDVSTLLDGVTAHDASGEIITGECTFDADTSDADAVASEILYGKSAYKAGSKIVGSMPNRAGASGTIATKDGVYSIQQGYHDGSGSVQLDSTEKNKLISGNIKSGVSLFGVTGDYTGEAVTAETASVTPTMSQQTVLPTHADYLSQVTVAAIPVSETVNAQGGLTLTVG